jgi:hypothetical protein
MTKNKILDEVIKNREDLLKDCDYDMKLVLKLAGEALKRFKQNQKNVKPSHSKKAA